MKKLWCWRCKQEVWMLDEDELRRVLRLRPIRTSWRSKGSMVPMQQEYERITGDPELPAGISHHRLSHCGPPCQACGKPLRSFWARICGSCMAPAIRMGGQPGVGIFWKLRERLIIDGVGLDEAVENGGLKTYPGTHQELWMKYRNVMVVSPFTKEESLARGRVVFDSSDARFYLFADPCIVRDATMLERVREHLNLPENTEIKADPEYRCPNCS